MPVYRADRESLLFPGDVLCRIGRIALASFDPRQPRRKIGGEEQADETNATGGCEMSDFSPFGYCVDASGRNTKFLDIFLR